MSKVKIVEILVYRTEPVPGEFEDIELICGIETIFWENILEIVFFLETLMCNFFEHKKTDTFIKKINDKSVKIGKKITVLKQSDSTHDIALLSYSFLKGIQNTVEINHEMFDSVSDSIKKIIDNQVVDFLLNNSNKKIRHNLTVEVDESIFKLTGKFAELKKSEELADEPPATYSASLSGLVKHNRTIFLRLDSAKIIMAYFNLDDFYDLHNLMKSDYFHKFTLQNKFDVGGKKDLYLISFEEINYAIDEFALRS